MKTRFFFPVIAMIACATVANAAAFKTEVNRPIRPHMVETASVNNVDVKVDVKLAAATGSRMIVPVIEPDELAVRGWLDTKADAKLAIRKRVGITLLF